MDIMGMKEIEGEQIASQELKDTEIIPKSISKEVDHSHQQTQPIVRETTYYKYIPHTQAILQTYSDWLTNKKYIIQYHAYLHYLS